MKKLICLVLVAVLAASLCVGCGKKTTSKDKTTLTIGLPTNPFILDYDNNALTLWLEEKCGVNLEFEIYSGGTDVKTQIATAVASGDPLPDIIWGIELADDVINDYGREETFQDLSEFFDDRDGASKIFWDRVEETFSEAEQAEIMLKLKDIENGDAIYCIPSMETSLIDTMDYQMWINKEWLTKLDLDMPHDIESLYDVLVAFKTRDPNGNNKADEVPLQGSERGGLGADVVNWLINMYIYFDDSKHFNVDDNGNVYAPFTTDQYREALKFINRLIKEGLVLDTIFTTPSLELAEANTPANGVPLVGIFAGHLTLHATAGNELLYQYEALPMWGNVVYKDNTFRKNVFITEYCENPEKAFEVIMTLWSEEGSYRNRYGEPGVNWTEPDEDAKSAMNLDCTIKIIRDPFMDQRTCNWGDAHGTLNVNSEGETAQLGASDDQWAAYKAQLHAASRILHDAAAKANNPSKLMPTMILTDAESKASSFRTNIYSYYTTSRTAFCKGTAGFNPNSDTDWNNYLDRLNTLGLNDWLSQAQMVYDRQTAAS